MQETAGDSTFSYRGLANSLSLGLDANQDPLPSPNKNGNSGDFFNIRNQPVETFCIALLILLSTYIPI